MCLFSVNIIYLPLNIQISRFADDLQPFFDWCSLNRLDINISKTFAMVISRKNKITILVNNQTISVVLKLQTIRCIFIDNRLSFTLPNTSPLFVDERIRPCTASNVYSICLFIPRYSFSKRLSHLFLIIV
jgi:hypothetical protein